jgi:hypothetical protein
MSEREDNFTTSSAARGLSRTRISRALTLSNPWGLATRREIRKRRAEAVAKFLEGISIAFLPAYNSRVLKPGTKVDFVVTFRGGNP